MDNTTDVLPTPGALGSVSGRALGASLTLHRRGSAY
jgi:hypothetical protein